MKIYVVLAGPLSKYGSGSRNQIWFFEEYCQLKELIVRLKIPEDKYSFATINGIKSLEEVVLQAGDEVKIFPKVSGG